MNNEINCVNTLYKKVKKELEKKYNSKNTLIRVAINSLKFTLNYLISFKKLINDKEFRAIFFLKTFKYRQVHQTTATTFMNRYPIIFSECSNYFKDKENIKILSYGCSTGEEVITLRRYFPNATIVGAEINKNSLNICKNLEVDNKIKFIKSTNKEIKKYGKFDAIFCMAVLQRTPHTVTKQQIKSLKNIYPFQKFEKQIIELDEYLNEKGLLIIHFSQYSFQDTIINSKYKVLGLCNQDDYNCYQFDSNSNLIEESRTINSIYLKLR